ncbi:hypothetical protein VSR68_40460 [Paraburkholderia phymatum]|uniref:hypothetical protein n=1 Tax=Paraburkholderia phymatum TaxID=148447 RepID=UPI00317708D2
MQQPLYGCHAVAALALRVVELLVGRSEKVIDYVAVPALLRDANTDRDGDVASDLIGEPGAGNRRTDTLYTGSIVKKQDPDRHTTATLAEATAGDWPSIAM